MKRWKHAVAGLAISVAILPGCQRQIFLTEKDVSHYQGLLGTTVGFETDPSASVTPATTAMPAPMTVNDTERKIRYFTLSEAIALALENGTTGFLGAANNFGSPNEALLSFTGRGVAGADSIRVLQLDPAIAAADMEASLSKFDAQWTTSVSWNATDQPPQGLNSFQNGNSSTVSTSLLKPLPTGGVAGITFSTAYQDLTRPPNGFSVLNPAYTPRLQFQFEQPLLQGFGIEINQLRSTHPGSTLSQISTGGRVEGILLTRIRFDEQRIEFEKAVQTMLVNVEFAYWNLYGSYWTLYSREQALRQAFEAWKISKSRFEEGRAAVHDFAQTRQQFELFRGQRLTALDQVLESERLLRALLNLPGEDGTRLVPIDTPTLAPFEPDWGTAANECLALRPDLLLARQDLKSKQLELINTKNLLLPDLRLTSTYGLSGIGTHLDGGDGNAFRSLAGDKFTDWSIGLRMNYALGYRDAHAQTRVARLNLARSYKVLHDQELKAMRTLEQQYRHLFTFHKLIETQRSQRDAATIQLTSRFKQFQLGSKDATLDILLEAQRVWADALRDEYGAIVSYNNALVGFEFAKGTILQHDNVVIGEGPLPNCAQVRAVEHERQRSKALILRERAEPGVDSTCDYSKGATGVPKLPENEAVPLSKVLEKLPPLPVIDKDQLPSATSSLTGKAATAYPGQAIFVPNFDGAAEKTSAAPKAFPDSLPAAGGSAEPSARQLPAGDSNPKIP